MRAFRRQISALCAGSAARIVPHTYWKGPPVSLQPISPGAIVSRIWAIYRDQFSTLVGTATLLYALQFVIYIVLSGAAGIVLALLFWMLSILYQGMVVELVQDVQDGRRDHSVRGLVASVSPVFWPLLGVSILFGLGVGIGFVLLIIPGVIVLVFVAVVIVSIAAGLAATSLGSVGRALVQWAVNAALAPVTALAASVLYFALRGQHAEPGVSTPPSVVA